MKTALLVSLLTIATLAAICGVGPLLVVAAVVFAVVANIFAAWLFAVVVGVVIVLGVVALLAFAELLDRLRS